MKRDSALHPYYARTAWWRRSLFWVALALETISARRLSPLLGLRTSGWRPSHLDGLEHVPASGSFVLAVNHYKGAHSLDVLASVIAAASTAYPLFADRCLIVIGRRARFRGYIARQFGPLVRPTLNAVHHRWRKHLVRIPLDNPQQSISGLRDWRKRIREHPALVFPEGKAGLEFGRIRPGAGAWLSVLGVPTLPVAAWWFRDRWQVRFGCPLTWAPRPELRDVQLGLAIAVLLPPELAPTWQDSLRRWREAHRCPPEQAPSGSE